VGDARFRYTVEAHRLRRFPLHLLSEAQAWPESLHDCAMAECSGGYSGPSRTRVCLVGLLAPDPGAWASFGWELLEEGGNR
jgi:hypothetical protein